jgi:UDP-glucose:(heptosyl)LPS alpha-1,3-glucosyltransferase
MRIALVNPVFSSSHGGLERFSINLATALHDEGHEVHVIGQRLEDLPNGVIRHPVQFSRWPSWWRPLSFQRAVRQVLATSSFDVVYGLCRCFPLHFYRMGDGVQRHWLRLRYPFALWRWLACLFNPVHLVNLYLESRVLGANGCRLVTNSRLCREHARHYYGVKPDRVQVIYNGVNHDIFSPGAVAPLRADCRRELGLREADIALLYISNNWQRKGLAVLMRAVAMLGEKGAVLHLVVVGRGRPRSFHRLAWQLGLKERVHFVGPSSEVQRYYAAGDLLVLPTLYDPFANVCLEAMASGLPVVTTSSNGAAELIVPGENGYIQEDASDAGELARLLSNCLDRDRLHELGKAALTTAEPFTRERNMQQTLDLFGSRLSPVPAASAAGERQ